MLGESLKYYSPFTNSIPTPKYNFQQQQHHKNIILKMHFALNHSVTTIFALKFRHCFYNDTKTNYRIEVLLCLWLINNIFPYVRMFSILLIENFVSFSNNSKFVFGWSHVRFRLFFIIGFYINNLLPYLFHYYQQHLKSLNFRLRTLSCYVYCTNEFFLHVFVYYNGTQFT